MFRRSKGEWFDVTGALQPGGVSGPLEINRQLVTDLLVKKPLFRNPEVPAYDELLTVKERMGQLSELFTTCVGDKLETFDPNMDQETFEEVVHDIMNFYFLTIPNVDTNTIRTQRALRETNLEHNPFDPDLLWNLQTAPESLAHKYLPKEHLTMAFARDVLRSQQPPSKETITILTEALSFVQAQNRTAMKEDTNATADTMKDYEKVEQIINFIFIALREFTPENRLQATEPLLKIYQFDLVKYPENAASKIIVDAYKNHRYSGVIDHHLVVVNFAVETLKNIQAVLKERLAAMPTRSADEPRLESKFPQYQADAPDTPLKQFLKQVESVPQGNDQIDLWQAICAINPYYLGIVMALHDVGRTLTHHYELHEVLGQQLLKQANVAVEYSNEPTPTPHFSGEFPPPPPIEIAHMIMDGAVEPELKYDGLLSLLVSLFDFYGKSDVEDPDNDSLRTKVRDVYGALQVFIDQDKKYKNMDPDMAKKDPRLVYSEYEAGFLTRLLHFLRDEVIGLGLDKEMVDKQFILLEQMVPRLRAQEGIQPY